jgi:hypothetical protein
VICPAWRLLICQFRALCEEREIKIEIEIEMRGGEGRGEGEGERGLRGGERQGGIYRKRVAS